MKIALTALLLAFTNFTQAGTAPQDQSEQTKMGINCYTNRTVQGDSFGAPAVKLPSTYYSSGPNAFALTVETTELTIVSSAYRTGSEIQVTISQTSKKSGEVTSNIATLAPNQQVNLNYFSHDAFSNDTSKQIVYSTYCNRK